jgi:hypothetical protein
MKLSTTILAMGAINSAYGHTVFTTLFVDSVDQGDGTCVRMPMSSNTATNPIIDLSSNIMACNVNGDSGVARVCPVNPGSKLSFLWREYADGSQPGAIDVSHKGPCAVYMKAVSSAISDVGHGDGWFKIWDEGYDNSTNQWCTEKVMANNGLMSVNIPADLAGGSYLVRPELLSLHEADKNPPQPQFYTGCAQVFLKSSATGVPATTVSIPGFTNLRDPAVLFNIYTPNFPYTPPGPATYVSKQTILANAKAVGNVPVQSEGLEPANCVLKNANWCGVELNSYSTAEGCDATAMDCWAQAKVCYDTAPPTGGANCRIWEAKCQAVDDACNAGNVNGPPNKGKDLNHASTLSYSIPPAPTVSGTPDAVETPAASAPVLTTSATPSVAPTKNTGGEPVIGKTTTLVAPAPSTSESVAATVHPEHSAPAAIPTAHSTPGHPTPVTVTVTVTASCSLGHGDPSIAPHSFTTLTRSPPPYSHPAYPSYAPYPAHHSNNNRKHARQILIIPIEDTPISGPGRLHTSGDLTCGGTTGLTCKGIPFAGCCSQYGWCGNGDEYCGTGCQILFGDCHF